jgi:hypothetical protein
VAKFSPPRGGISNTLSPQEIVTGLKPDASKHCKIPFRGYAQVHVESSQGNNAMVSRTVGAISLEPVGSIQGKCKFMSLLTEKIIKGRSFTPLPMPENVIAQVEGMASDDTNERRQLTQNKTHDHGGGYNRLLDDEDDISLGTEEFSRISEAELNDIRVNNEEEIEEK